MPHSTENRRKITVLSRECPFPLPSDYRLRTARIIELLLENWEVELLCFRKSRGEATVPRSLLPDGLQISWIDAEEEPLWKRLALRFQPEAIASYSSAMRRALEVRANAGALLWVSRMEMGQYVPLACALGYQVVLDEQSAVSTDLFRKGFSSWVNSPALLLGAQYRYFEKGYCERSHAVIAATPLDAARLQKLAPGASIHLIPDGVDSVNFEALRALAGTDLVFTGALNTAPAQSSLRWFVAEILPRLRAALGPRLPRIVAAGTRPDNERFLQEISNAGIQVAGDPESLDPYLRSAAVTFFPYREETHEARIRVLEAMASGRAVVSTPKAIEGLALSPSFDVWVADQPDAFTSAILRLLDNEELRLKTAERAVDTIERLYDWRCMRDRLENLFGSLEPDATKSATTAPAES